MVTRNYQQIAQNISKIEIKITSILFLWTSW